VSAISHIVSHCLPCRPYGRKAARTCWRCGGSGRIKSWYAHWSCSATDNVRCWSCSSHSTGGCVLDCCPYAPCRWETCPECCGTGTVWEWEPCPCPPCPPVKPLPPYVPPIQVDVTVNIRRNRFVQGLGVNKVKAIQ